ncbi:class A sortase [Ligilactobacillus sp. LYQ139]|uniref:class A sortase n=1 Tax=Ligilactobacillus sp. LYQ139 TaxID=3378800 RepID=UPI003851B2C1
MSNHAADQKIERVTATDKKHATFNYSGVEAANISNMLKAMRSNPSVIGKIAIPSDDIHLPIYYGVSNYVLLKGAGTLSPTQKMGEGNYALASHHVPNKHLLFSSLGKIKLKSWIYLTDGEHVYIYKTYLKKIVNEDNIGVLRAVSGEKICTLVTCRTWHPGETKRIVVKGRLIKEEPANNKTLKVFAHQSNIFESLLKMHLGY